MTEQPTPADAGPPASDAAGADAAAPPTAAADTADTAPPTTAADTVPAAPAAEPSPKPPPTPGVAPVPATAPGFGDPLPGSAAGADTGVPTIDSVREKIERRYGTALGMTELAEESAAGRSRQEAQEQREAAARDKLEAIRRSLHPREDST